jgi:hypothetical protein
MYLFHFFLYLTGSAKYIYNRFVSYLYSVIEIKALIDGKYENIYKEYIINKLYRKKNKLYEKVYVNYKGKYREFKIILTNIELKDIFKKLYEIEIDHMNYNYITFNNFDANLIINDYKLNYNNNQINLLSYANDFIDIATPTFNDIIQIFNLGETNREYENNIILNISNENQEIKNIIISLSNLNLEFDKNQEINKIENLINNQNTTNTEICDYSNDTIDFITDDDFRNLSNLDD